MRCPRCQTVLEPGDAHCCAPTGKQEFYKTSALMIGVAGSEKIYRSVDEVPERFRDHVRKAALESDPARILIADQRGRDKLAELLHNEETEQPADAPRSGRKLAIIGAVATIVLGLIALLWFILGRALA